MGIRRVCVYCASSRQCDSVFLDAARSLGRVLARHGLSILYGGGGLGVMGGLAEGALSEGGEVIGVLPRFMREMGWGHEGLSALRVVEGMLERSRIMLAESDAFIALPGGSGTLEELFQAISWKRLGLHTRPIVVVNLQGYFDPCLEMLQRCLRERFMDPRHERMWTVVKSVGEVMKALRNAPPWDPRAIEFASL